MKEHIWMMLNLPILKYWCCGGKANIPFNTEKNIRAGYRKCTNDTEICVKMNSETWVKKM